MEFNIQKFLVENKLTKRSILSEDDVTGAMLKTDDEQDEMSDEEEFGDEEKSDSWYASDSDDSEEFEKEPSARDIKKSEPKGTSVVQKQAELKGLEDQKDALLMQLKSGVIGLDQYKAAIGNIPARIKKLRADIDAEMNVSVDDEEEL